MVVPSSSYRLEQQTRKHAGTEHMQPHYTNGATAPQSISPKIPARLNYFLPSDPLLPNKTHPAPGNQGWILHNMARTHRETHLKLSLRIRDHGQK